MDEDDIEDFEDDDEDLACDFWPNCDLHEDGEHIHNGVGYG